MREQAVIGADGSSSSRRQQAEPGRPAKCYGWTWL